MTGRNRWVVAMALVVSFLLGGFTVGGTIETGVILDATGWFPALDTMRPISSPVRLVDTRAGQLGVIETANAADEAMPVAAGTVRRYLPLGRGGIPASGVAALSVNVVAILPAAAA